MTASLKSSEDTVNRYKLWNREVRNNPHPIYSRIREEEPVCKLVGPATGSVMWLFSRYDDVIACLRDPRFVHDFRRIATPEQIAKAEERPAATIGRNLLNLDPPDHTRLRTLVQKAFTSRMVARLEPRIHEITDALVSAMLDEGDVDLIDDFAFPLPVTVIALMLGIPPQERHQFREWSRAIMFSFDDRSIAAAGKQMTEYFMRIFELRRTDPRDDLISALLVIEEQGDRLNTHELLSMLFLLLVAGHETTVNLIGNGILTLLRNPDQLSLLRKNPCLVGSAVEEILRYEGPVENTITRFAEQNVEWAGRTIRRGELVFASLLSANRDAEHFAAPDVFDITRNQNKHIPFGSGIHYCLGAPLARLEGAIAINTLIQRAPDLRLAVEDAALEWNDSIIFRGVKRFPISF